MKSRSCRLSKHEVRIRHRGMAPAICIKRRFMLMSMIYRYFYLILGIIIWTVSVWMKIIFYAPPRRRKSSSEILPRRRIDSEYFGVRIIVCISYVRMWVGVSDGPLVRVLWISAAETFTILLHVYVYICVAAVCFYWLLPTLLLRIEIRQKCVYNSLAVI